MERSKKKVQLWKNAAVHFLLCFVMGFFTGFAPPTRRASLFSGSHSLPKTEANRSENPIEISHGTQGVNFNKTWLDRRSFSAAKPKPTMKLQEETPPRRLVIIVTPTATEDKIRRAVLLRRLANTLRLVAQPLMWVVVERHSEDSEVSELLWETGIMCRHLVVKENNFTDMREELDHQRNVALTHIEHHRLSGTVHFAGLFGVYDLDFFHHLRLIEGFGAWPIALLGANKKEVKIEGPVCDCSRVIGWHLKNNQTYVDDDESKPPPPPPPIRVSNFAFNSSILWDPERWGRASSFQNSLNFIKKEVIEDGGANLMGIPQEDCSRVLLWNLRFSK
ncbi:hypothetical protein DM860_012284 [Cuscuta australis]|uniref:Glycosyltransferases n=1 Tax=Cuscuta australis TaxID=267555 RepID=A0A328EAM8_9ASTE|nr:hypothetical protein DM860_012284 [Cuscuta australis]